MDINLEVLQYLIENEYLDHPTAIGIAKKIVSDKTIAKLSKKQKTVFEHHILHHLKPLCNGIFGDGIDSCRGDGIIDDESLLSSYDEHNMLCQLCRDDKAKHNL